MLLHRRNGLRATWAPRSSAAADDTAEDGEEDEGADGGTDPDDEVFVVVDPAADFLGGGGAFALTLSRFSQSLFRIVGRNECIVYRRRVMFRTYILAFPSTSADGAVKEILLHLVAGSRSKFWRCTRQGTALAVTGVGIVFGGEGAH